MARMICSARMYQNDPKVTVLCRLVGLEGTPLPIRCWPFLVQALACLQGLFVDLWPGIVQASIKDSRPILSLMIAIPGDGQSCYVSSSFVGFN